MIEAAAPRGLATSFNGRDARLSLRSIEGLDPPAQQPNPRKSQSDQ
jgi:hypothetical protein